MIGNITGGKGFRGTLNYLMREGQDVAPGNEPQIVGGNMAGQNARELAREFRLSYEANPKLDNLVKHISLSLLPGEELNEQQWSDLTTDYMQEMGYSDNQYVAILHQDTPHPHIHIVASRGRLENPGRTNTYKERWRSQRVLRGLEQQFGLTPVRNSEEIDRKKPEIYGELQEAIERSLDQSINPDQFSRNLSKEGIEVSYRRIRNGEITGIAYVADISRPNALNGKQKVTGTKLGRSYRWSTVRDQLALNLKKAQKRKVLEAKKQEERLLRRQELDRKPVQEKRSRGIQR